MHRSKHFKFSIKFIYCHYVLHKYTYTACFQLYYKSDYVLYSQITTKDFRIQLSSALFVVTMCILGTFVTSERRTFILFPQTKKKLKDQRKKRTIGFSVLGLNKKRKMEAEKQSCSVRGLIWISACFCMQGHFSLRRAISNTNLSFFTSKEAFLKRAFLKMTLQ